MRGAFQTDQPECATGDTTSTTSIALVGDSNAAMWFPPFEQVARQRNWRLETLSKASCPLLDLPIINPILGREYTECNQWRTQIISRLGAEHPRLIVLAATRLYGSPYEPRSSFAAYDQAWLASLGRLVHDLRGTGAKVLVLGPIPNPQSMVADCLSSHLDDASACSPRTATAVNQPGITAEATATRASGGDYSDLTPLFCTKDRCPVIVGNTLVYSDKKHITLEYSRVLTPVIEALTARALA